MKFLVLLHVTAIQLAIVVATSSCYLNPLYPYGEEKGDYVIDELGDTGLLVDLHETVPFFGDKYSSLYIFKNGFITFDHPTAPNFAGLPIDVCCSFMTIFNSKFTLKAADVGRIMYRQVDLSVEPDIKDKILRDTTAMGDRLVATFVFIITWKDMTQHSGDEQTNTFQLVISSNLNRTIFISNYGSVVQPDPKTHVIRYGNVNGTYIIYTNETIERLDFSEISNVDIPGRLVQRVDKKAFELEEFENILCHSCVVDRDTGHVTTFDGSADFSVKAARRRFLISKVYRGEKDVLDQCQYKLRVITDNSGRVDWVSFAVGVHPRRSKDFKRDFAFDRHRIGQVMARGHGPQKIITEFPYQELITDNGQHLTVVVEETNKGWLVHSPSCQYVFTYNVLDDSDQVVLSVGDYYRNVTVGLCQNINDDITDDLLTCTVPPKPGDIELITDTCSCPRYDKACNKLLNAL